jgi:hypothetical protein
VDSTARDGSEQHEKSGPHWSCHDQETTWR